MSTPSANEKLLSDPSPTPPEYEINTGGHGELENQQEQVRLTQEWTDELNKLEDEISTLRQVLSAKVRQASELKQKLGHTAMAEFKSDVAQSLTSIKQSDAFQKTNSAMKAAGQKTASAWTSISAFTTKKFGDMRNSPSFKSFEEKVGDAYSNVKDKVGGSQSTGNFADMLPNGGAKDDTNTNSAEQI